MLTGVYITVMRNRLKKIQPAWFIMLILAGFLFMSFEFYCVRMFFDRVMVVEDFFLLGKFLRLAHIIKIKTVSMLFFTLCGVLYMSSVLHSLSSLFMSSDLNLLFTLPVSKFKIFWSRFWLILFSSSIMVFAGGIPFIAGVFESGQAGIKEWVTVLLLLFALITIFCGLGILTSLFIGNVFSVQKARATLQILSVILLAGMILMLRSLRPERFLDPQSFNELNSYVQYLQNPILEIAVSDSFSQVISGFILNDQALITAHIKKILIQFFGILVLLGFFGTYFHYRGFLRFQEGNSTQHKKNIKFSWLFSLLGKWFSEKTVWLYKKEFISFFRTQAQWSQLLVILMIQVIYFYNIQLLPIEGVKHLDPFMPPLVMFGNMFFILFILLAISSRFLYPAISFEGRAFFIIRTIPYSLKNFLMVKLSFYLVPLIVLGLFMTWFSCRILNVPYQVLNYSLINVFFHTIVLCFMGLAFGSIYPDFNHENIARVPTGFGAMLYIFWGLVLLAVSSALQFITFCIYAFSRVGYIRFMMRYSGISTFMLILDIIICVGICVFCYRASERALQYEQ